MLITLSELLARADAEKYAVIAPDFPSLFLARTMLEQAEELRAPLILSYATLFKPMCDLTDYSRFIRVVREEAESASTPVVLHLDHATSLDEIREAVQVGFTSVMLDASFEPYEVNLARTQQCIAIAHPAGVSVEAELGHVPTGKGYVIEDLHEGFLTDPRQAVEFVEATGIDALAVAIGTVHGPFKGAPKLDFSLLEQLNEMIRVPLVLHGSSGLSDEDIERTIHLGIRKINVYTEILQSVLNEAFLCLEKQRNDPLEVAQAQADGARKVLEKYFLVSGSTGRAHRV